MSDDYPEWLIIDEEHGRGYSTFVASENSPMYIRSDLVPKWHVADEAPHEKNVLMAWPDETIPGGWRYEAGMVSWGWRRDGVSNMSRHGLATHFIPLPAPPTEEPK